MWQRNGTLAECSRKLCVMVSEVVVRFGAECERARNPRVAMVDFSGESVVAATEARCMT